MTLNNPRTLNIALLAVMIGITALLGAWIFSYMEKVTVTENFGYTKEARMDPFLGAQLFLNKTGIDTEAATDFNHVITSASADDTILLLHRRPLQRSQRNKMSQWLENGGHLIILASQFWDEEEGRSNDVFLDSFGVQKWRWVSEEDKWQDEDISNLDDSQLSNQEEQSPVLETLSCGSSNPTELAHVGYDNNKHPLSIDFDPYLHLTDSSGNAINETGSPNHVLQYTVGKGRLTVLSDIQFLRNNDISWYDHSFFLWLHTTNSHHVWFIFNGQPPSLFSLLWQSAHYWLISLLVLLCLWVGFKGARFGPLKQTLPLDRRRLLEHLEASIQFNWRHKHLDNNIENLRTEIKHILQHKFNINDEYHKKTTDSSTVIERLSELTKMDVESLHNALYAPVVYREHDFIKLIRNLQTLRHRL